jgi:hypothetical protein
MGGRIDPRIRRRDVNVRLRPGRRDRSDKRPARNEHDSGRTCWSRRRPRCAGTVTAAVARSQRVPGLRDEGSATRARGVRDPDRRIVVRERPETPAAALGGLIEILLSLNSVYETLGRRQDASHLTWRLAGSPRTPHTQGPGKTPATSPIPEGGRLASGANTRQRWTAKRLATDLTPWAPNRSHPTSGGQRPRCRGRRTLVARPSQTARSPPRPDSASR